MWGRSLRYRSSTRCLSSGEDGVGSRRARRARRAHSTGIHTFKRAERRQRRAVRRITRCSGLAIRGRTGSDPSGRRTHFEPLPCGATRVERRAKIIRCGSMSNWPVRSDTLRPSTFDLRPSAVVAERHGSHHAGARLAASLLCLTFLVCIRTRGGGVVGMGRHCTGRRRSDRKRRRPLQCLHFYASLI